MNIEIDFKCGICGRDIKENEMIYAFERICDTGYEITSMCEDCRQISHKKLREIFPRTVVGLN